MDTKMTDVMLHIDENTDHEKREMFRDSLLSLTGVMTASYQDEKPHLVIIEYNPDAISSSSFINVANENGFHAELVGL